MYKFTMVKLIVSDSDEEINGELESPMLLGGKAGFIILPIV